MTTTKYYLYVQSNSGGNYIECGNIRVNVIIEARSSRQADQRADKLGLFDLPFCECCGARFYPGNSREYDTETEALRHAHINHYTGKPSSIVHHISKG